MNFVDFSLFLPRETTFNTSCLLYCTRSSKKGSSLKGKNLLPIFAPIGSKFVPFGEELFLEAKQHYYMYDKVASP